jgi:hypothetical protein
LKEVLEAIQLFAVHFAIYCLQKAQFFTKARFILWAFPDLPGRVLFAFGSSSRYASRHKGATPPNANLAIQFIL